jgi:hypothetical protein
MDTQESFLMRYRVALLSIVGQVGLMLTVLFCAVNRSMPGEMKFLLLLFCSLIPIMGAVQQVTSGRWKLQMAPVPVQVQGGCLEMILGMILT